MSALIYHYTDRLSAADIRREGLIRATPLTLHLDMFGRDTGYDTDPVVWLTVSPNPDQTVVAKMRWLGWPLVAGDVVRFALPADYPGVTVFPADEHATVLGREAIYWQWVRATAVLAGSNVADHRYITSDVPLSAVTAIEELTHSGWEPLV